MEVLDYCTFSDSNSNSDSDSNSDSENHHPETCNDNSDLIIFNKFTHVIMCNQEGVFFNVVPYIYTKAINGIFNLLEIVPKNEFIGNTSLSENIDIDQYTIKDDFLQLKIHNPTLVYSLIEKQINIIPLLHQELRQLEILEMLDINSAKSLSLRLIAFLNAIKLDNYLDDGISWCPENYMGYKDKIEQNHNEKYDDYIRRAICTHIKCRNLPMLHIISMPENHSNMLLDLIDSLSSYSCGANITNVAQSTYFAPIFRNRGNMSRDCIKILMAEEFRCIKNDQYVDNNNLFVFNNKQLDIAEHTINTNEAQCNLRYYVGDYFDELDLSRTFITGSSITASIINTKKSKYYTNIKHFIEIFYPKVITKLDSNLEKDIRDDNINLWVFNAISETEGIARKNNKEFKFKIYPGSDVDMVIDDTVSDDEYRNIAESHYNTICRYYDYAKMRIHTKPRGDWNYIIYTDDPNYIPVFRTVEIYRSSFRNICSHHVGAVRGCYTSRWSDEPQFYLTASAVFTSWYNSTPNYHYFAGKKSYPQDIIIKNIQRGIGVSDKILKKIIINYMKTQNMYISFFPFYKGKNVPYSIFMAPIEYCCYIDRQKK